MTMPRAGRPPIFTPLGLCAAYFLAVLSLLHFHFTMVPPAD